MGLSGSIPTRTLRKASDPQDETRDFTPLCPPAEPFWRILSFPSGNAMSSYTATSFSGLVSKRSNSFGNTEPEVMKKGKKEEEPAG